VSGGRSDPAELIDQKAHATRELKRVEAHLAKRYGTEGLYLIRAVLGLGKTLEGVARELGEVGKPALRFLGSLFRYCLKVLAVILGFATKDAYRRPSMAAV
jgi:hypothetical protein